jgi:hypothetical protein
MEHEGVTKMKNTSGLTKGALALGLAVALLVPVTAMAVPGRGGIGAPKSPTASSGAVSRGAKAIANMAAKQQALRDRIAKALGNRARAFDAAASRIGTRIDDVAVLADKIGLAGGDVSGVKATLDQARGALQSTKDAEAGAVSMFKAVPAAADRKAAFAAARAKAREARADLSDARTFLRSAILKLEAIVSNLPVATP